AAMVCDWAVYGHHVSWLQALGIPLIVVASLGISLGWSLRPRPATAEAAPVPAVEEAAPAQPVATADKRSTV
ncbi:hypothetical protein ACWDQL_34195, partial [Streptomyces olivaceus]